MKLLSSVMLKNSSLGRGPRVFSAERRPPSCSKVLFNTNVLVWTEDSVLLETLRGATQMQLAVIQQKTGTSTTAEGVITAALSKHAVLPACLMN